MTASAIWRLFAIVCLTGAGILFSAGSSKSKPKAWIGIAFLDVAKNEIPAPYKHNEPEGAVKIQQVIKGASGEQAGLMVNDFILAIDGNPLKGRATLLQTIQKKQAGDVVELTLGRQGKLIKKKMALSPRPEDMRNITKLLVGSKATPLKGTFYQGDKNITLEKLKGKVVLLDFWATWCGPCIATLPSIEKLQKKYGGKDFTAVGISSESLATLKEFQKKHPSSYPLFNDTGRLTQSDYSIMAFPTLVFIDKQGIIQRVHPGFSSYEMLESRVQELLKL